MRILLEFLRGMKKRLTRYTPSVEVLISKTNLIHNLREYQKKYPKLFFAPVLKSNAYGHGLVEVAKILDRYNVVFFGVDSLYEGMILRNKGVKSPVLILGYTNPENIKNCKLLKTTFTITSLDQLRSVAAILTATRKIHLKIDTGMHRQGLLPDQINEAIKIIKGHKFLDLEGVCSHLADADSVDVRFTDLQIGQWRKAVLLLKRDCPTLKFFHIFNTAGIGRSEALGGDISNVARLGIGLYGFDTSPSSNLKLFPALSVRSVISSVKDITAGESVGYGLTFIAKKTIRLATVPVGYFEGVDRRLSNIGAFKIRDIYLPVVGRVSMNITSVDLSAAPETKLGDQVIIISERKDDRNSVENISRLINTIPYEILVHIPQHLRRVVV